MKKFAVVLLALLTLTSPMTALANSNECKEEKTKVSKLESDERLAESSGEKVRFDGKDIKINSYLINRSNYVRIRDVAALLKDTPAKFMVSYDNESQKVIITKGENQKEDFTYVEKTEEEKIAKTNKQKIVDSKGKDHRTQWIFYRRIQLFPPKRPSKNLGLWSSLWLQNRNSFIRF